VPRLVALAFGALLLVGCLGLPSGTPEERARRALDGFAQDLGPAGGALSKLSGNATSNGYTVGFTLEVGRDGARHFNMSVAGFALDFYCRGEDVVRVVDGKPLAQRPGACPLDASRFGSPLLLLPQLNVTSARTEGSDVVAVYNGTNLSVGGMSATVDRHDRITSLRLESPGGNVTAEASYGPRAAFRMPSPVGRLAAAAGNSTDLFDGNFSWRADLVSDAPSLAEVEVRVFNATTHERLAAFRASMPQQQAGGFNFTFDDRDHDGTLSDRDRFWIERPGWTRRGQYDVQVWDAWAEAPIVRRLLPGPEVGLLLATGALAALLARRR